MHTYLAAADPAAQLTPAQAFATVLGVVAGIGLYWLPSIIAAARHVPGKAQVVIVNFFAFVLGVPWVIALVMAFRAVPRAGEAR